jgi:hypothetical protein
MIAEEKSESFLRNPTGNTTRFLSLCTEALNAINAIPALRTQIWKRMRTEIKELVESEAARVKEKAEKLKARRAALGHTATDAPHAIGAAVAAPGSGGGSHLLSSAPSAAEKEDGDLLLELFDSVFSLLTAVLKSHIDVSALVTARLAKGLDERERKETLLATTPAAASGLGMALGKGSGSGTSEVSAVWEVMQIQLQVLLCDYLQARGDAIAVGGASSAVRARRKAGLAALEELSFSFEDSAAPSVAK